MSFLRLLSFQSIPNTGTPFFIILYRRPVCFGARLRIATFLTTCHLVLFLVELMGRSFLRAHILLNIFIPSYHTISCLIFCFGDRIPVFVSTILSYPSHREIRPLFCRFPCYTGLRASHCSMSRLIPSHLLDRCCPSGYYWNTL